MKQGGTDKKNQNMELWHENDEERSELLRKF